MKVSTATLLLAAALGASAHPSGHAHRHMHRSVEERDFIIANRPAPPPPASTSTSATPPPAPTSTSAPAPAPAAPTSSVAASSASSASTASTASSPGQFCGGVTKRATAAEIAYAGNTGAPGQYGCNLMIVDSPSGFDYTAEFSNAGGDQACVCWNKIGPTGGINGFFSGNEATSFTLPAGGTKYLAAEANSQGGCSCFPNAMSMTSFGQFAGTWFEFDFGNDSNGGWSGADASCLVAAQYDLTIPGLQVCGAGTCSTINPGGSGTNAFVAGTAAQDGLGLNIPPGSIALTVKVGYS